MSGASLAIVASIACYRTFTDDPNFNTAIGITGTTLLMTFTILNGILLGNKAGLGVGAANALKAYITKKEMEEAADLEKGNDNNPRVM